MDSDTNSIIPPSTSLRPDSEQKVDLHVYLVPSEVWNEDHKSAVIEVISDTKSLGFVRVWPELSLFDLRDVMKEELGDGNDEFPEEFVYLRSVGRCLTQVKGRQELELRAKDFRPPRNDGPEIFLLSSCQDVPDTALIEASKRAEMDRELAREAERRRQEEQAVERERLREEKGNKSGRPSHKLIPLGDRRKNIEHGAKNISQIVEKGSAGRLPAKNIVKPMKATSPVKPSQTVDSKTGGKTGGKSKQSSPVKPSQTSGSQTAGKTGGKSKPAGSMTMNELKALQNRGGPPVRKPRVAPKRGGGGTVFLPRIAKADKKASSNGSGIRNVSPLAPKQRGARLGKIQIGKSMRGKSRVEPKVEGRDHGGSSDDSGSAKPQVNVPGEKRWEQMAFRDTDREVLHKLRQRPQLGAQRNDNPPQTNRTLPPQYNPLTIKYQYPYVNSEHSRSNIHTDVPNSRLTHQSSILPTNHNHTPGLRTSHPLSSPYSPRRSSTHIEHRILTKHSSQPLPQRSPNRVTPSSQQRRSLPTSSDNFRNQLGESRSVSISEGRRTRDHSTQPSSSQYSQLSTSTLPEMHSNLSDSSIHKIYEMDISPGDQTTSDSRMQSQCEGNRAGLSPSNFQNIHCMRQYAQESFKSPKSKSPPPDTNTNRHLDPSSSFEYNDNNINNASTCSRALSSPAAPMHSDAEPHPQGNQAYPAPLSSPRKGVQPEVMANSDSGIGENTPEESQQRLRGDFDDYSNQPHVIDQNERPLHPQGVDNRPYMGPNQGQYDGPGQYHQEPLHQPYDQQQYQQQQQNAYPKVRTRGPTDYQMGPPSQQLGPTPQSSVHETRTGSQDDYSAIQQSGRTGFQDHSPRGPLQQNFGPYQQDGKALHGQQRRDAPAGYLGEEGQRYGPQEPDQVGGLTPWRRGEMRDGRDMAAEHSRAERGMRAHPQEPQKAMEGLQLDSDGALSPKHYPQTHPGSPEVPSSGQSSQNPAKQRLLIEIREEQQQRLEMEKAREELIKKAKALQGKTVDRRKKARDYWKKRYYDEKKKTPSLEEHVSKVSHQVQQQNRKLMSHLEGKGAKAPKGPPSKKMDHKIQIFKHQHDIEEMKRYVDNARMKLATEIKLRTQAETELRILKTEVIQKKIKLSLERGEKKQPGEKKQLGARTKIPRPAGRTGNSV